VIKVSVLYPNNDGSKFDFAYYTASHMPMVRSRVASACRGVEVDEGIAGGTPGAKAPYVAMAHLLFDSVEAFQQAFGPHAKEIMGDIPNYTDIQPVIQISNVKS